MAERAWLEDRGSPVNFGPLNFAGACDATSSATPLQHSDIALNTAIVPFNAYVVAAPIVVDAALSASDFLTVKIRKGTTVIASTQITAGNGSLNWTFTPTENTIAAGASLNVICSHTHLTTSLVSVDVWLSHRSNTL